MTTPVMIRFTALAGMVTFLVFMIRTFGNTRIRLESANPMQKFIEVNPPIGSNEAELIAYLHAWHLTPPSTKQYSLTPTDRSDFENQLKQIFKNQRNGFFVEAGANDGEYLSNTLWLEKEQNWSGLLVEPNSFLLPALRMTNRKAWIADVGLSTDNHPRKVRFIHAIGHQTWNRGRGIIEKSEYNVKVGLRDPNGYVFAGAVECFPLATLLRALNQTVVDFFSLDVEGIEYKILEHFPFDQILIKVIAVEHYVMPESYSVLQDLLTANNFNVILKTATDVIAVHRNYADQYKLQ